MSEGASDYQAPSVGVKVMIAVAATLIVVFSMALDYVLTCGAVALGWYVLHAAALVGAVTFNGVLAIGLCTWVALFITKSVLNSVPGK